MIVIEQSFKIEDSIDQKEVYSKIEKIGRVCYKSEDRITEDSAQKFISKIIKNGHESVLEHVNITIRFITDRGVTHELVRHRIASYSQESTRYCNYNNSGITFIAPYFLELKKVTNNEQLGTKYIAWVNTIYTSELAYHDIIESGGTPEEARAVLPNSLKTEIIVTTNLREWRHILKLRTSKKAHPQIRNLMIGVLKEFKEKLPIIFEDINV